jgi:GntR family transcriptional regulator/MocR family aminotransferase
LSNSRLNLDLLALNEQAQEPLHRQLYTQLRSLMLDGVVTPGSQLPSSRSLAVDLGISRNTVSSAYEQLAAEGYILTHSGSRAEVANLTLPEVRSEMIGEAPASSVETLLSARGRLMIQQPRQRSFPKQAAFHPGTPDVTMFPFGVWRKIVNRRLQSAGDDIWGYHFLTGYPPLKEAICRYLRASRGVNCDPQQIVITTGAQGALDLISRLLLDPGDSAWVEEPGYLGVQSTILAAGGRLLPLHTGLDGWKLDYPERYAPKIIYLTPSCQFPLGVTMGVEQRLQILDLARKHGCWIIEDDFDSEYRFKGRPVPAMWSFAPYDRMIYIGSFSKTLFPALRLGFLVLPEPLEPDLRKALSVTGHYAPLFLQAALCDFIEQGEFAKHLSRMRRLYAERRAIFLALCNEYIGKYLEFIPSDSGIQVTGLLKVPVRDTDIVQEAEKAGMNLSPLSMYYRHGNEVNGFVLGYAAIQPKKMKHYLSELRSILQIFDAPDGAL